MNETVLAYILVALTLVNLIVIATNVLLIRRARDLAVSVECLCSNLGGLREQIGHGH